MSASDKKKLRKEQKNAVMTEKQQKEAKKAKELKMYTVTFAVIMILVVAVVIGATVRAPIAGMINRGTHAFTVGDHELSTTDFNYYYVDAIDNYYKNIYNQYYQTFGNYWAMMLGFNLDTPLDEQIYDEEKNTTWADYFVDQAISDITTIYALYDEGVKNNHEMTDEEKSSLENTINGVSYNATYNGFSSADSYLRNTYGFGANLDTYRNYCTAKNYAASYFTKYSDALTYTEEQIKEHQKGDKYNNFSTFTFAYYAVNVSSYLGEGTKDEDGKVTYTDEQKAAAVAAARADAEKLVNSKANTQALLDKEIKALEINKDNSSVACTFSEKVFYEDITYTDIREWVADPDRKVGELGYLTATADDGEEDHDHEHENEEENENSDEGENADDTENSEENEEEKEEEITGFVVVLFVNRNDNLTQLVNVRHILYEYSGAYYEDGELKFAESKKKEAKEKAEAMLKQWQEGDATAESFGALANEHSDDSDGKDGGLYERVYPGQMVDEFDKWCFDSARKPGDTGIVETQYGCHIIYYQEQLEETYRDHLVKEAMRDEDSEKWVEELKKTVKTEKVNLSGIEWDFVVQ